MNELTQLRQKHKEEFEEELKPMWKNAPKKVDFEKFLQSYLQQCEQEIIDHFRERAEEKKKVCGGDLQMNDEYEQCHGYNQALSDLIQETNE